MEKYVAKFGSKYLKEHKIANGVDVITLTDELFEAKEVDRESYHSLARLIDLGADIREVTFFESTKNWDIAEELKKMEQAEVK